MEYRKRLIKNRIEAYDNQQEFNIQIPKLNIMDSILLCKEAWDSVTNNTIYNCWVKTGILPSCYQKQDSETEQDSETVQDSEEEQDIEVEKQEFQNLLNAYYNIIYKILKI